MHNEILKTQQNRIKCAGYGQNVFRAYEIACHELSLKLDNSFLKSFTNSVSYICIKGGRSNAVLFCEVAAKLGFSNLSTSVFLCWQKKILEISKISSKLCKVVLERNSKTTGALDLSNWLDWVSTGLRYGAKDVEAMISYFSLANKESLSFFYEQSGTLMFLSIKDQLQLELKSLFNISPQLVSNTMDQKSAAGQRASFCRQLFLLPSAFLGSTEYAHKAYQAAAFHMAAHLVYGQGPFKIGQLKPLQIAIVSLIEDARVESLAGKQLPGLTKLWAKFHDAPSSGANTATRMFARLSRALIDPKFDTDDGWVIKGRRMFLQARDNWADPKISRVIGNILGNELGQLRVQFNSRDYSPLPIYRDDNNGVWDLPDNELQNMQIHDLKVDVVEYRKKRHKNLKNFQHKDKNSENEADDVGKAKLSEIDEQSARFVRKLPEFDYAAAKIRKDWVTIFEYRNAFGSSQYWNRIETEYFEVIQKSERLFRSISPGAKKRLKRQFEGENLDLDASIDASISIRTNTSPEQNFFEDKSKPLRSLAVHLLLDTSESTRAKVPNSFKSVLELERDAAAILAKALHRMRDPFAISGFCSNGRNDVRMQSIKTFDEEFSVVNSMNLAGLKPEYSTRMGAALRHCGYSFSNIHANRKLILLVTDGAPSDIDVDDLDYLFFDARRAVSELQKLQIDVFCVALGEQAGNRAEKIFGPSRSISVSKLVSLPSKLANVYLKLTS